MDPSPISFTLLLPFTFTRTVYFLAHYYCFPLDTLNHLFIANRWDWQPHRKLGAKFLVVLYAGFTLLLVQSKALDEAPYKLSEAVAKLAGITFWSLTFSYWFDKSRFLTEGRLATVLIIPSCWGSHTTTIPCSKGTAIKILCVSSRKKMKWKSLKVTTYFKIFPYNTLTLASLNPKI
jgi:hypothetical protein